MHEFSIKEICFYALCWAIAFVCAFARTVRDNELRSVSYGLSFGATSGFLAFGAVCFLVDRSTDSGNHTWFYLGVAALIGLLAKEQDKLARLLVSKALGTARLLVKDEESEQIAKIDKPKDIDTHDRELHS